MEVFMAQEKRKTVHLPEELWVAIKAAAKKNNRTLIGEIKDRF